MTKPAHRSAYWWIASLPMTPKLWTNDTIAAYPQPIPATFFSARTANQKPVDQP